MCDCINNIESQLTEKVKDLNQGCEIVDRVEIINKALMLKTGTFRMFSPITARYRISGRVKKFDDRLIFTYCPICGEKY